VQGLVALGEFNRQTRGSVNGSPLGADLFEESVIKKVAARENWNDREREGWESLKTSLRIELGVSDLRLWESVEEPKAVDFTSRLLVRVSEEVRGASGEASAG
jgi:hypothetical protein